MKESATLEFPGDIKPKDRVNHRRQNSTCLVHDLLEINNLKDKAINGHASLINISSMNPTSADFEPLSKGALSQLVVSVRDLSQSLSKFSPVFLPTF